MNIKYSVFAILLSAAWLLHLLPRHKHRSRQKWPKYYEQCWSIPRPEGTMTDQSRQTYCACTAENMKKMVIEDLQAMQGQDQAARDAINKVLIDVNGPACTSLHDKGLHKMYDRRKQNIDLPMPFKRHFGISFKTIPNIAERYTGKKSNIYDPMGALMDTQEYKTTEKNCLSCAAGSPQTKGTPKCHFHHQRRNRNWEIVVDWKSTPQITAKVKIILWRSHRFRLCSEYPSLAWMRQCPECSLFSTVIALNKPSVRVWD